MTESDLVFTRESASAHESIWELLYQVSVDLIDLAAVETVAGLFVAAVEAGAGQGVLCWVT